MGLSFIAGTNSPLETFYAAVSSMANNPALPADTFRQCVLELCKVNGGGPTPVVSQDSGSEGIRVKVRISVRDNGAISEQVTTLHFTKDFFMRLVKAAGSEAVAREQIRQVAATLPPDVPKRHRSEEVRHILSSNFMQKRRVLTDSPRQPSLELAS